MADEKGKQIDLFGKGVENKNPQKKMDTFINEWRCPFCGKAGMKEWKEKEDLEYQLCLYCNKAIYKYKSKDDVIE